MKYRFAVAIVVDDTSRDIAEIRDPQTFEIIRPAVRGARTVQPGEEVELPQDVGDALIAKHGAYKPPPQPQHGPIVERLGAERRAYTI